MKWRTIELRYGPYTIRHAGHRTMPWQLAYFDRVLREQKTEDYRTLREAKARAEWLYRTRRSPELRD